MRRRRLTPDSVRQLERDGKRCTSHHPNWQGVRCERVADGNRNIGQFDSHRFHHGEGMEWVDARTAA